MEIIKLSERTKLQKEVFVNNYNYIFKSIKQTLYSFVDFYIRFVNNKFRRIRFFITIPLRILYNLLFTYINGIVL